MLDKVGVRDMFFRGLRGKAWTRANGMTVDLELVVRAPDRIRAEILGPLGVRVGLLLLDADWIRLYIPREKLLLRFPAEELAHDTERRARFLHVLPIPVETSVLLEALATRVRPGPESKRECAYDHERNAYRLTSTEASGAGRLIWVDPTTFAPLEARYYTKGLPVTDAKRERPEWRVVYSELTGSPPATLPSHIEIFEAGESRVQFEWVRAEAWPETHDEPFTWEAPAGVTVRDY